jgi:PAS domain S-box-containing protein
VKIARLSIRATLLTIIGILNILIAILLGSGVYHSWENLHAIKILNKRSVTINLLYNTEKYLSFERGLSMTVLDAPERIVHVLQKDLLENRGHVDERLNAALTSIELDRNQDKDLPLNIEKVNISYKNLKDMRLKLDAVISSPEKTNDEALHDLIFDSTTATIDNIEILIKKLSMPILQINTTVAEQMFFKHSIWEITEYAGREYATIERLITKNTEPSRSTQDKLLTWKSRTEHDWEISNQFAENSGLTKQMAPYINEAQTHYFMTFDQIKDMFYETGQTQIKPPYPIDIELWLEMSSQAIDSLIALKDIALKETQNYIENLEKDAIRVIALNLFLFACALALSFYSWHVILSRVIKPVNTMVDSLYNQAHRTKYASFSSALLEQDEIAKLGVVLEVFQESTRRIEQASKDLEQQRDNLQAIFEAALDAIVVINENGMITEWNSRAEELFGWLRKEILGKELSETIIPPAYRAHHKQGLQRFLTDGTSKILNKRIEIEALNKEGNIFPVELAITAIKIDTHYSFTAFISDISARKKAEEELRHYTKNLEDSNRELDDFAYIASHDLKEPLRGMHNFSRFLLEDYDSKLDAEGKNMLHTIANLTKRMDELLSSLLHYSRLGRTELSVRQTDLNEIVNNAITMHSVKIKETGAEVKILQRLPAIVCDYVRIAEVFQNIIGNALKYTEKLHKKIEIGYTKDHPDFPNEIVYFVRDNGIGIEKRNLDSIFKIFRRLHAQDAFGGGTGSGLTIAKKIINQHDGKIWAESAGKEQGTTFYFTIPPQILPATQNAA